ncbi:MAG: anhydro-N-acetylmuramic acid kinase [Paraglaciecola sp.]|jgi:anhydro-N-acetylmuramic acid kinase
MPQLYIGLMSGTSIDGIDAAIVDFSSVMPRLIDCQTYPYPQELVSELHQLCSPGNNEIVRMGHADRAVAEAFSSAVHSLLQTNSITPQQIIAIGSHGQTIRHMPHNRLGFSLQIGDPNTLAIQTGIDVIADFRRKDIALGGQGAPLVPAFHQAVFAHCEQSRVIVNIGGIANITYLPASEDTAVLGWDTGPGNTLMDAWCKLHTGRNYDDKGQWAAQCKPDPFLLQSLSSHPYFTQLPPKSTGRELFHLQWVQHHIAQCPHHLEPQVVQATLVALTSRTIAQQIINFGDVEQVYVCGGGAQNEFLMQCLENDLHECKLTTTDSLGIPPDAVEAIAFAWFAWAFKHNVAGNLPSVTGAKRRTKLGVYCPHD